MPANADFHYTEAGLPRENKPFHIKGETVDLRVGKYGVQDFPAESFHPALRIPKGEPKSAADVSIQQEARP